MREWNAESYHRISNPMLAMAIPVLQRLTLRGDELVIDVGCGSGLVTEKLLERLPSGRVVAVDVSMNMLQTAREHLRGTHGRHVRFVLADAAALPLHEVADAIFSTATFHWALDHAALFASLFRALKPGGRLVAQCGGGPNIQRLHDRATDLMRDAEFAPYFASWREPWEFANADTTRRRLEAAGRAGGHRGPRADLRIGRLNVVPRRRGRPPRDGAGGGVPLRRPPAPPGALP